ncbi:MAG: aminotransferase class V-fold PLP-dependent enzyme [Mariniblastus sp.]|nr:aminotransferase class V-fold PLP-dependent enzyme [Mariniblastus sp.]
MDRIYLDNAATSWPKPESVYSAIDNAQRIIGAPAGRGGYQQVVEALRLIEQTRGLIARFINAPDRRTIAFTFNGTDSLSTALFGLLRSGDHVVTSVVEHNSVLRPLHHLESESKITTSYVDCNEAGTFDENAVIEAIEPRTRLVCLNHVSNVTGSIQPIQNIKRRILDLGREDIVFLVDAAQSMGHIPIDIKMLGCDILAAPGHKAIMGPLGTGILYVSEEIAHRISPLRYGGTGTDGSVEIQPTKIPDKFESGNLNVPGIAGINAGIRYLTSEEGNTKHEIWKSNSKTLLDGLLSIDGATLQGNATMQNRIGVFSISIPGFDCHEASHILDDVASVQTRAGLHCAPLLHRALNTEGQGGTIRLSVGLFNTEQQIEVAIKAITQLAQAGK